MEKALWWLLAGSRDGKNRIRIIRTLDEHPMNANQPSETLGLGYKTVRHHLDKFEANDVVITMGEDYGQTHFLTQQMEAYLDVVEDVAAKADFSECPTTQDSSRRWLDRHRPSD